MKLRRGLTLPELLVALAVMAILIAVAAPSFRSMIEVQRLRSVNSQLVTDLQFARSEAATRGVPMRVVFDVNGACYVIFTSAGTPAQAANSQRCNCLAGPGNACNGVAGATEVRTVSLPTSRGIFIYPLGVAAMAFDPSTGGLLSIPTDQVSSPMPEFRVTAWLDGSRHLYDVLNQSGRPTVCSPAGTTLGEAACAP